MDGGRRNPLHTGRLAAGKPGSENPARRDSGHYCDGCDRRDAWLNTLAEQRPSGRRNLLSAFKRTRPTETGLVAVVLDSAHPPLPRRATRPRHGGGGWTESSTACAGQLNRSFISPSRLREVGLFSICGEGAVVHLGWTEVDGQSQALPCAAQLKRSFILPSRLREVGLFSICMVSPSWRSRSRCGLVNFFGVCTTICTTRSPRPCSLR